MSSLCFSLSGLSFSTLLSIFFLINIKISTLSVLFLLHSLTFTSLYLRKTYANVSINYTLLVMLGKKLPILLHHSLFLHLHNPLFSSPLPLSSSYPLNLPAICVLHLDLSLSFFLKRSFCSLIPSVHHPFLHATSSYPYTFVFLFSFKFSLSHLLFPLHFFQPFSSVSPYCCSHPSASSQTSLTGVWVWGLCWSAIICVPTFISLWEEPSPTSLSSAVTCLFFVLIMHRRVW